MFYLHVNAEVSKHTESSTIVTNCLTDMDEITYRSKTTDKNEEKNIRNNGACVFDGREWDKPVLSVKTPFILLKFELTICMFKSNIVKTESLISCKTCKCMGCV